MKETIACKPYNRQLYDNEYMNELGVTRRDQIFDLLKISGIQIVFRYSKAVPFLLLPIKVCEIIFDKERLFNRYEKIYK